MLFSLAFFNTPLSILSIFGLRVPRSENDCYAVPASTLRDVFFSVFTSREPSKLYNDRDLMKVGCSTDFFFFVYLDDSEVKLQNSDKRYLVLSELERLVGFRVEENLDCRSDDSPGDLLLCLLLFVVSANLLLLLISFWSQATSQDT